MDELLLRRVLYGISCRNYESAAELVPGAIGAVDCSSVLRAADSSKQAQRSCVRCRSLISRVRTWWRWSWTCKTFADASMVVALRHHVYPGTNGFLGFVETDTENERVLRPFLRSLVERGRRYL